MQTRMKHSIFQRAAMMLLATLLCATGARAEGSGTENDPWISGDCNVTLINNVLTVSKKDGSDSGAMADYTNESARPWKDNVSTITSVVIGSGVTTIGNYAFQGCSNESLTSVTIPDGVTKIGDNTFRNTKITSVSIPGSVTTIGYYAFKGCEELSSITISSGVTTIETEAFYGCSALTSINIPNSVTSITPTSFTGCSSLTTITVESGNTKYDSRNNCNAIICKSNTDSKVELVSGCKTTTIPDGVQVIGETAFQSQKDLTSITIPSSVTSIGNNAFFSCI